MGMHVRHGEIPTCEDCRKYVYDKDWRPYKGRGGQDRMLRSPRDPLPCIRCPKAAKGKPNPGADLIGRNWKTWLYFLKARAGLPVPDDPLLHENIGLISMIVEGQRWQSGK